MKDRWRNLSLFSSKVFFYSHACTPHKVLTEDTTHVVFVSCYSLTLLLLLSCFIYLYQLTLFSEVVSGTFQHNTRFSAHIHSLSDKSFLTAKPNVSLFFITLYLSYSHNFSFSSMKSLINQCFEFFLWIPPNADYFFFLGKGSVRETQTYWCTTYIDWSSDFGRSIQCKDQRSRLTVVVLSLSTF